MRQKVKTILNVLCALMAGVVSTLLAYTHSYAQGNLNLIDTGPAPIEAIMPPKKNLKRATPY